MPSTRKFHRRVITIVVLSEEPYDVEDLANIAEDITTGDNVGTWAIGEDEILDGPAMAKALEDAASATEFFGLTEEGNDLNCAKCGNQFEEDEIKAQVKVCSDCK